MMKSEFLKLNVQDLIRGFIVTVIAAILTSLVAIFNAGGFPSLDQMKTIGVFAVGAGISYLIKNLFTNSEDKIMKRKILYSLLFIIVAASMYGCTLIDLYKILKHGIH